MKIFSFLFIFFIAFFNFGWTQTEDSISNLGKPESLRSSLGERFEDEIIDLFSSGETISSTDIDNSIVKSFGDILKRFKFIDVASYGIYGQPEIGTVFGGTSQQIPIYIDGIPFSQQSLYFPQTGDFDFTTVPMDNIDTLKVIDGSVINILGRDIGIGGLEVKQKDYYGGKAFSRAKFQSGPNHYRHTQIDLGRGLTSKGRFYLTGDFRKYGGTVPNSDLDSRYLTGKFTFNLKKNWELKFNASHFHTEMGIPDWDPFKNIRKNESDWRLDLKSIFEWRQKSKLCLNLFYSPLNQENRWNADTADIRLETQEKVLYLKANQEIEFNHHHLLISGEMGKQLFSAEGESSETLDKKTYGYGYLSLTDLFKPKPKLYLLLFLKYHKFSNFRNHFSSLAGISYQLSKNLNLYCTIGNFFKDPIPFDEYFSQQGFEGKTQLKEERTVEINSGAKLDKEKYKIKIGLTYSKIKNSMIWMEDAIPRNEDKDLLGSYAGFLLTLHPDFEAYLSYAYKNSQYKIGDSKYFVPFMPRHSAYSYLQYKKEFLKKEMEGKIRLEGEYLSERYLQYGEKDSVPSVFILNSKISLRFLDFHFYYVVENITDQKYRTKGEFFMPERTFWWGFCWNFWD
jgi:outer membrane cobalamin receptor